MQHRAQVDIRTDRQTDRRSGGSISSRLLIKLPFKLVHLPSHPVLYLVLYIIPLGVWLMMMLLYFTGSRLEKTTGLTQYITAILWSRLLVTIGPMDGGRGQVQGPRDSKRPNHARQINNGTLWNIRVYAIPSVLGWKVIPQLGKEWELD